MTTHRSTKKRNKARPRHKNNSQVLGLVLIGAGLIVLAALAMLLLPKPGEAADSSSAGALGSTIPVAVDYPAPDLSLTNLQGEPVNLTDYRGQVVLVNNWAIWCPPCKAEMPVLQSYHEDHGHQGFSIIGIEAGEPPDQVAAFVEQYGLTFPVWVDQAQQALLVFRNDNLPSSYVIDQNGQVRLAWTGAISRDMLEKYVTPLLEQ